MKHPVQLDPSTRQIFVETLGQLVVRMQTLKVESSPAPPIPTVAITLLPQESDGDEEIKVEKKVPVKKKKTPKKRKPTEEQVLPRPPIQTITLPYAKQFSLQQIQDIITRELNNYHEKIRSLPPDMRSVDKRKHNSQVKKDFYFNYKKHVSIFMDGFLFPHKELKRTFESQLSLILKGEPTHPTFPPFTKLELQQVASILTRHVDDLDLTPERKTKIYNLVKELQLLFASFLDFSLFLCNFIKFPGATEKTTQQFQQLKLKWIENLNKDPYKSLGDSTKNQIKKGFVYYKLKL
jgi:hypothetical protein